MRHLVLFSILLYSQLHQTRILQHPIASKLGNLNSESKVLVPGDAVDMVADILPLEMKLECSKSGSSRLYPITVRPSDVWFLFWSPASFFSFVSSMIPLRLHGTWNKAHPGRGARCYESVSRFENVVFSDAMLVIWAEQHRPSLERKFPIRLRDFSIIVVTGLN